MDSTIDDRKSLLDRFSAILSTLEDYLIPACVDFCEELERNAAANELIRLLSKAKTQYQQIRSKVMRNTNKCTVFGESLSGKTTLINALLEKELLHTGVGTTSNYFVEIKTSIDKRSFLLFKGEEMEITPVVKMNELMSTKKLPSGLHVDLYYHTENCRFMDKDAMIIDTPCITNGSNLDKEMESYCIDADLIIIIMPSNTRTSDHIKNFIDRFKYCFTKLNIFIVYNYWDIQDHREDREVVKSKLTEEAKSILCKKLGYSDEEAIERIYFLSAYERILVNRNDIEVQSIRGWQLRNEAFLQFITSIQVVSIFLRYLTKFL